METKTVNRVCWLLAASVQKHWKQLYRDPRCEDDSFVCRSEDSEGGQLVGCLRSIHKLRYLEAQMFFFGAPPCQGGKSAQSSEVRSPHTANSPRPAADLNKGQKVTIQIKQLKVQRADSGVRR